MDRSHPVTTDGLAGAPSGDRQRSWLPLLALALVAGGLVFWNLGNRYLWQDEAACAVLAERMVEHGRPLSYDGTNLITMDEFRREDEFSLPLRTGSAQVAVDYFTAKGDFKRDTTWIGQPWGQFVVAALGLELFGHGTWQARSFFALAGVLTVLVLFSLVRRRFDDPWMATVAAALLLGNVFWYLHVRQARYYSTATLFCLLTFAAYLRWQDGRRWGGAVFVLSAWTWFQQDFGSVWPVYAVLGVDALLRPERRIRRPVLVFGALAASVTPFVFGYEMFGRVKASFLPWDQKLGELIFSVNQYQLPLLVLPLLVWLCVRRRIDAAERRVVVLAALIVVAQLLWMPTVGPAAFYRYIVDCTPLSCLLLACAIVRTTHWMGQGRAHPVSVRVLSAFFCGAFIASPLPALPTALVIPDGYWTDDPVVYALKPELAGYFAELRGDDSDPNRAVVEFLEPLLEPGDEILCNYEDIPLMFYTDQPIRGGIPAFRVLDDERTPPRFVIIRSAATFTHTEVFRQAYLRHEWVGTPVGGPDIPWGNNPDPTGHYSRYWGLYPPVMVFERVDTEQDASGDRS